MNTTDYKFKLLDVKARQIIRDSSFYHAVIDRVDGIGHLLISRDDVRVLEYTGVNAIDGTPIFEEDVVEAIVDGERTNDVVRFLECGWRFGGYEGTLLDYPISKVIGNCSEVRWPDVVVV